MSEQRHPEDTMRWVRRAGVLAALLIGWVFILVTNNFHITPPVVFACLGYFAAVAAIYTLYRTGATAVTQNNEEDDAMSWVKPLGALDELEREKRTLLKAIKEAEFDQQMGKLSKADADAMILVYRSRAIEVIKEIDVQNSTSGAVGSIRDRILREARARIHIETAAAASQPRKKDKQDKQDKKGAADKQKSHADKTADASAVAADVKSDAVAADVTSEAAEKPMDKPIDKSIDKSAIDKSEAVDAEAVDTKTDLATDKPDPKSDPKSEAKAVDKSDGPAAKKSESKEAAR